MHIVEIIKANKKKSTLLLLIVDIIFFSLISPSKLSWVVMAASYMLVLLTLYVASCFSYKILLSLGYIQGRRTWLREGVTLFIFLLLMMQSVGQLSGRDVLSLIAIASVAYFYYSYIGANKQAY